MDRIRMAAGVVVVGLMSGVAFSATTKAPEGVTSFDPFDVTTPAPAKPESVVAPTPPPAVVKSAPSAPAAPVSGGLISPDSQTSGHGTSTSPSHTAPPVVAKKPSRPS